MDKNIASYLLASLLERAELQQVGVISNQERDALTFAIRSLAGDASTIAPAAQMSDLSTGRARGGGPRAAIPAESTVDVGEQKSGDTKQVPAVELVLNSLQAEADCKDNVLLCLDFGTAMSKAFAITAAGEHLDLELGKAAGREGYTLPSSVFIGDDGLAYFGFEAVDKSVSVLELGRERLDSIKSWLSFRDDGNPDSELLSKTYNPTDVKLTEGDLLRAYLAFLTDMTCISLRDWEISRYVKRRFARPCGKNAQQAKWVDDLMKRLLADAQVLADTFHGRWGGGVPVEQLKAAIEALRNLGSRPGYLVADGVPEPVAVAATPVEVSENRIDAYMVVDAGAGTTDFGLFFAMRKENLEEPRVFQVAPSILGLNYAGDRIDLLLQKFICDEESIDQTSMQGKMVALDLRRRIRVLKELLFVSGELDYVLADSTIGHIKRDDFCNWEQVQKFSERLEQGFRDALASVDVTYLDYLATDPVRLQVILTGGSSKLPMLASLGSGYVEVKGRKIQRTLVDATPEWIAQGGDEMQSIYPQLAVAIGGAAEELPSTDYAPLEWIRRSRPSYVAGNMQITGT
ncbi:hypothetical protein [Paraburkholderia tropica]|uniref:hypothetical protein n=1 Tax=Paraburkholderia tropica TaxID=92647 RepID=UPI0015927E64|nr:hypothetical protein [Paraburkholderia tropica]